MDWKKSALIHAKETNTKEVCGLICIVKGRKKYWPCENIADDPTDGFCLSPDDWIKAEDAGELVGVFHSHPFTSPQPSQVDLSSCEHLGLPFYIVNPQTEQWHDFKPTGYKAPLIGRQWTWGSSDCWTLVIDYFAEKGLRVENWTRPNRPEEILTNGIFERLIPRSNFVEIDDNREMLPGDLLLMKFTGPDPDHVAIYIGEQMVLHHMAGRLSSRDLYNQFLIDATVRRYRHAA